MTDSYQFDAYGQTVSSTGSTVNPYHYSGERRDAESGMYQLRARYYHPGIGRFMSRDPFAGRADSPVSRHRYLYANDDPVNGSDPTGLETLPELSVVTSIQVGLGATGIVGAGAAVCTASTTVAQARAVVATTRFLFLAGAGAQVVASIISSAVNAGNAARERQSYNSEYNFTETNKDAFFTGLSNGAGWDTGELPSPGLKQLAIKGIQSGGQFGIGLGLSFHGKPPVVAQFLLAPPPVKIDAGFEFSAEAPLYEFALCGAVKVAKVFLKTKLPLGIGKEFSSTGAFTAKAGLALELGFSLFGGAFELGLPLISFEQTGTNASFTLLGYFSRSYESK